MKKFVVCVRDSAAAVYNAPWVVQTLGLAERSFRDEVQRTGDAQNMLNKHPEDFELWLVSKFDEDTGMFEAVEHQCLVRGKDCVTTIQ